MGYVADTFDGDTLAKLPGPTGDRPRALLDGRREQAVERAADPDRLRARPDRASATTATWSTRSELRDELVRQGSIFQSSSDTEVVLHLYARSQGATVEDAIVESVSQVQGAFSLVMLTKDRLIAVRDPHGFRPLALGRLGDAYVVCSETCAMDLIGATYVRDVEPGEVLVISADGLRSIKPFPPAPLAHCVFEHVYFARPDSYVFGTQRQRSAHRARARCSRASSRSMPTSSCRCPTRACARRWGSPKQSGMPLRMGLIRNHYVGPHVHPAAAVDPPLRRQGEAESGAQHPRRHARHPGRRLDRARHDQPEDRQDGAGGRRAAKCTCASAVRRRSRPASTASTRRGGPS